MALGSFEDALKQCIVVGAPRTCEPGQHNKRVWLWVHINSTASKAGTEASQSFGKAAASPIIVRPRPHSLAHIDCAATLGPILRPHFLVYACDRTRKRAASDGCIGIAASHMQVPTHAQARTWLNVRSVPWQQARPAVHAAGCASRRSITQDLPSPHQARHMATPPWACVATSPCCLHALRKSIAQPLWKNYAGARQAHDLAAP
ncbi:hypothetical protein AMTR_s00105p00062730 [Amborella trichopoda]|uniref:Uncharacterized protein n=1 Tax=Amborella trichopoda TaxID=13333 RepID=W1NXH0_AMBTC|nr:hypothetical protein AMTR_s00105p00062730 [Amborella trichopoda]